MKKKLFILLAASLIQTEALASSKMENRASANNVKNISKEWEHCKQQNSYERVVKCFDNFIETQVNADSNIQTSIDQKTLNKEPTENFYTETKNFGLKEKKPQEVTSIETQIEKVTKSAKGQNFFLENGQQWRQADSKFFSAKSGDSITISRGALGAYYLKKTNKNRSVRVKRIK